MTFTMLFLSSFRSAFIRCLASAALVGFLSGSAFSADQYAEDHGSEGNGDHTIGLDYAIDPDLTDRGNPKGKSFEFSMPLSESKIFPGDDSTLDPQKPVREERKIVVYVPAAYQDGTAAPLLVTLDGPSRLDLVRNALDNLTISDDPDRKLPAFIAIAVQNGGDSQLGDGERTDRRGPEGERLRLSLRVQPGNKAL